MIIGHWRLLVFLLYASPAPTKSYFDIPLLFLSQVGPSFVPVEMVEASVIAIAEEQTSVIDQRMTDITFDDFGDASLLTPDVAIPIAKRLSEVAFQLILEPGAELESETHGEAKDVAAAEVVAAELAANLRWSQFNVLLSCADAMREYASEEFE